MMMMMMLMIMMMMMIIMMITIFYHDEIEKNSRNAHNITKYKTNILLTNRLLVKIIDLLVKKGEVG